MYKRVFWLILYSVIGIFLAGKAQQPRLNVDSLRKIYFLSDSADTGKVIQTVAIDTITVKSLRPLDSLTKAMLMDSLNRGLGYPKGDFEKLTADFMLSTLSNNTHHQGDELPKGEVWILAFVALLLVVFAVLRQVFAKQLFAIVQSFFSNRALSNLNKEDNLFTSWPFLLLFIQFGFTIGMFFYLVGQAQGITAVKSGFPFYVSLSVAIIILYIFKILLLRVIGFIFNVQKPVNEYVSILYLSYFNTSLLFMPLVVALVLSPLKYASFYVVIAVILLLIIFVFQFIRAGVNVLSNYRFSKVYLILYFCTLEICPILILIKAIGF